jgi:hypothetical protein
VSVTRIYHTSWILCGVLFIGGFVVGGELGSPPIFVFGMVGAVVTFVYAMYLSLAVIRSGDRRLLKRGIRGTATVLQAHRTSTVMQAGEFEWMAPWVWKYHLRVKLPAVEPYDTVVSICAELAEGMEVEVAAAPHNHKRVTIDVGQGEKGKGRRSSGGNPTSARLSISLPTSVTGDSGGAGGGGGDSISKLERLADLHDRGVLSDDEFAAEKHKVLGDG